MTNSDVVDRPAAARPLGLSRRRDLVAQPVYFRGRRHWCLKDPLALRYYQLRDEEHFVLRQLDGSRSLDEIQENFARAFAPRRLDQRQLHAFLGTLHREGLVSSSAGGLGSQLLARRRRQTRDEWLAALANPLAVRLRGVDPERFLTRLHAACRGMCSTWWVLLGLLVMLSAVILVAVQWDTLEQRLPTFEAFFQPRQLIWLAIVISGAKILHELAHGLACKHYGGECHELGLMFLVFTPCLYCNVTDAWMLPSKWQRMAVSAAGMYVDLLLAAACTWVWWFTTPGLINSLCLNMMVVGTVGTLVFNGNPLLRYDGYYVLSDLFEVPNLRTRATAAVRNGLARLALGIDTHDPRTESEPRGLLVAYDLAATAYRWFLTVVILAALHRAARPYGLSSFVELLAVFVIGLAVLLPLWRLGRWLMRPRQRRPTPVRLAMLGATAGLILAIVGWVPLPCRVTAPAVMQAGGASRVYITVPGRLIEARSVGELVEQGDILARLENSELDFEIAKLTSQRNVQRLQLDNLRRLALQESQAGVQSAGSQVPTAEKALADLEERLRKRQIDRDQLVVRAPVRGTIFPARRIVRKVETGELPTWTGTPLDEPNRGCYLPSGAMFCQVGDSHEREAILLVDESDIDLVHPGQRVRLQFDHVPGSFVAGQVADVAATDLRVIPPEFVRLGSPPTRNTPDGHFRSLHAVYQVSVRFEAGSVPGLVGGTGYGKITVSPLSLGARGMRFLRHWLPWLG